MWFAIGKDDPLVSVVVPTRNSAKTLRRCLESVRSQVYKNIELIVVDNYSIDETCAIAGEFGAVVLRRGPERSSQKNGGARHARGEWLYFVDSDFVLERDVVGKCVEAGKDFDAVSLVNYSMGESVWGKSIALKERFLAHDPALQTVHFVRRKVFFEVGGFDESLVVGEDLDLYARLLEHGYRIGCVDAVEWHIGEPETLRDIARRNFYYGKVVGGYFRKRGNYAMSQLSPFKPRLVWMLVKSGSPYLASLAVVDVVRWLSSLFGFTVSRL